MVPCKPLRRMISSKGNTRCAAQSSLHHKRKTQRGAYSISLKEIWDSSYLPRASSPWVLLVQRWFPVRSSKIVHLCMDHRKFVRWSIKDEEFSEAVNSNVLTQQDGNDRYPRVLAHPVVNRIGIEIFFKFCTPVQVIYKTFTYTITRAYTCIIWCQIWKRVEELHNLVASVNSCTTEKLNTSLDMSHTLNNRWGAELRHRRALKLSG